MPLLVGLPGTSRKIEAVIVDSGAQAVKALRDGKAATAAGPNGAINVWIDDGGRYRCHLQVFREVNHSANCRSLRSVSAWVREYLARIQ